MRKTREILRLHLVGGVASRRQVARAMSCSKTAVSDCLRRAAAAGLSAWEAIEALDEGELERRFSAENIVLRSGTVPRGIPRPKSRSRSA
jgi:hypothetical protein